MTTTDKMALDLSDSPELSEYFSRKEVGEECKITIDGKYEMTATIDEIEPSKMVVLSLKHEPMENEEGEAEAPEEEDAEPVEKVMPMKKKSMMPMKTGMME